MSDQSMSKAYSDRILELEAEIERLTAELEHHKGKAEVWEDVARAALTPASDRHQLEPTDEYGVYSTDANKQDRDPFHMKYGYEHQPGCPRYKAPFITASTKCTCDPEAFRREADPAVDEQERDDG